MDDPWANAWGEPSQSETVGSSKGSSQSRSPINNDDKEADIAIPSWSTGVGVQWDIPSNEESLWTQPANLKKTWEPTPSPYDHLPIGKGSDSELNLPADPPPASEPSKSIPASPLPTPFQYSPPAIPCLPSLSSPAADQSVEEASTSPRSILKSRPASPEGFGTFRSAVEERRVDPWTPSVAEFEQTSIDEDNWGSGWGISQEIASEEDPETESQPDEWETARKQKELQDQRVPPEVLASILSQTHELVNKIWPEGVSDDSKEPKWSKDKSIGMDVMEGLQPMANRIVPHNLVLSQPVQFRSTATAKGMVEALRLTRNAEIMAWSPLALYLGAKGSMAWEASLKTKPNVAQEEAPAGWRIVEKEKEPTTPLNNDGSKGNKSGGGLLSFWSKKQAPNPRVETKIEVREPSPPLSTERTTTNGSETEDSRRSSLSARPPSTHSVISPTNTNSLIIPPTSAMLSADNPVTPPQSDLPKLPTPPPSVVSRFLNRFSRSKSGQGSSNHNTLALSSDDLEFLSDIAPTAGNDTEDGDFQFNALSSMIISSPLPDKLPPPLAPPPKAPPAQAVELVPARPVPPTSLNGLDDLFAPSAPPEKVQSSPSDFDISFGVPKSFPKPQINDDFTSFCEPSTVPEWFTTGPPFGPLTSGKKASDVTEPGGGTPPPLPFSPSPTSPTTSMPISKLTTSFAFPRPPGSRPETPVRAPAPRAIMSSPTDKALATFSFPPAPTSSRPQTPLIAPPTKQAMRPLSPPTIAALSPLPSNESRGIKPPPSTLTTVANLFDDDDFADFSPIPPAKLTSSELFDTSFTSSTSSDRAPFNSSEVDKSFSSDLGFDDFDDFVSSVPPATLRTPSPPRPPAKSSPVPLTSHKSVPSIPPSGSISRGNPKNLTLHQRKASQAIEHQRARSLVEHAAMRVGQWPAPPTPIPNAIPPPGANFSGGAEDLFSGCFSLSMGEEQERAIASLSSTASSPLNGNSVKGEGAGGGGFDGFAFPPPPAFKFPAPPGGRPISPPGGKMQPPSKPPVPVKVALLAPTPTPVQDPSAGGGKGGLSASDLSFFEGL